MDHRDFLSKLGCFNGQGIQSYCFLTVKNFLEASSMHTSPQGSTSSQSTFKTFQNLMLLSSSLFVLYISIQQTFALKDTDDDKNDKNDKNDSKTHPKTSSGNDDYCNNGKGDANGTTIGLGVGLSDSHNKQVDKQPDSPKKVSIGLGVGLSDSHNKVADSPIRVGLSDSRNKQTDPNESKSNEQQLHANENKSNEQQLHANENKSNEQQLHATENKSNEKQLHVGLGVGLSDTHVKAGPTSNIGSTRRQTIISKSVVGNSKKETEKTTPTLQKNDVHDVIDKLPTGITEPVSHDASFDDDIRYEDIFADKTLGISSSPLRKSTDENEYATPSKEKAKIPFPDSPSSPYDADDDKLTMLHVVSTTWTLPIKVNVDMNREDAISYFSYHKDKTDNPKFKFECFTLTSPFSSWVIEKGLFEVLTLEIKIHSEFPNIRDEIIKKGGKTLSRSELEQFRSSDLESSLQLFTKIIGDYFVNIMSRKDVLRKKTTNSILIDFFDPPSFKRPRDPKNFKKKAEK